MSCKTRIFDDCILAGETLEFPINWTMEFSNRWEPNQGYAASARVRPSTLEGQTGREYESGGGQSDGDTEPDWASIGLGETLVDGSITWTARALSNNSLRERISSATWPDVAGFTISNEAIIDEPGGQITSAQIGAAAALNGKRSIKVEVTTTAGNEYVGIIRLKVE
jgi:hypothetical protein